MKRTKKNWRVLCHWRLCKHHLSWEERRGASNFPLDFHVVFPLCMQLSFQNRKHFHLLLGPCTKCPFFDPKSNYLLKHPPNDHARIRMSHFCFPHKQNSLYVPSEIEAKSERKWEMLHDLRTNGYILQKINRLNACYDFPVFNWNICMSIPRFFFTLSFCKRGSTLLCPSLPLAFCELTNFYAHKRSRGGNSECRVRFVCLNRYSPLRPIYACCRLLIKRRKSSVQLS